MKIAMIGQKGVPARFGGIERYVEELGTELVKLGHEVTVFCRAWYTPATIREHRGMKLVHVPSLYSKHFDAITHTFFSILTARRNGAEIYHFHGVGPSLLAWLPKLLDRRAKVITTFHCIDRKHAKWGWVARMILRLGEWCACAFADRTVTIAKTLHLYCIEAYDKETDFIPIGVAAPVQADTTTLAKFGLEPGRFVAFIGRLVRHKRVHDLIVAWKIARAERGELFAGLKLCITGPSAFTDEYVNEIKALIEGDASIVFTGVQSDAALAAIMDGMTALVHPSESEGMPVTILEAMVRGKTVVTSDLAESQEATHGFGITFKLRSVPALTEKLIWLLEHKTEATRLAEAAREFVLEHHTTADMALAYSKLYGEMSDSVPEAVEMKTQISQ